MKTYLTNVIDRLIKEKEQQNTYPNGITFSELTAEVREDVLNIMRSLHSEKMFKGNKTLNDIIFTRWTDK